MFQIFSMLSFLTFSALVSILTPTMANAQADRVPTFATPKEEVKPLEKKELGWKPAASISALYSTSTSENVIGQTDGTSQVYGLSFKGSYTLIKELSEWRNSLNYTGATTKTPAIPRYIKSSDELKLESIYLHSLPSYPKIGPYVKGSATTALFRGEDVRNTSTTYVINNSDGSVRGTQTDSSLPLTDAFKPLTLQESLGMFWKPKNNENMTLELRGGLGAIQVFAKDQLAVQDKANTTSVEITELKSFTQTGLEAGLLFKGKIDEKTMYELNAEALTPLIKESNETRDSFRLTNFNVAARLSSQITSWASIAYDYKLKMQPQLIEKAQIQHMLVLNINYNLF